MSAKVYCVSCQRLILHPSPEARPARRCHRCELRLRWGATAYRALERAGVFARSPAGVGQLGGCQ